MATFAYKALTDGGRLMQGTLEAASHDEATSLLEQMPVQINALEHTPPATTQRPIGRQDFLLFNQQLATITKAGIPLERSLRELSQDIASDRMRSLIVDIATDMEAGVPMEEAFGRRKSNFPPMYGHLLKAGVETGRLGEMLTSLNRQVELTGQTKRIIIEAMTYPAILLCLLAVITSFIYTWIIPAFEVVLQEMVGGRLNAVSEFIFQVSHYIVPFWLGCGLILVCLFLAWRGLAKSSGGRRFRENTLMAIPVLGRIYRHGALARLSETMAVTLTAGCSLPESIRVSAFASSSEALQWECENLAQQLEEGRSVLEAGALCHHLPRLFLYSMQLGIQRNDLPGGLRSLTQMYTDQTHYGQSHLQAILLPLFIVVLGCLIMMTVLGIFLPMIQVLTGLSGV